MRGLSAKQAVLVESRMKFMPCTVEPSDSVAHARALLIERRINHLPVVSKERVVGIVSARDLQAGVSPGKHRPLVEALDMHPDRVMVGSVMATDVQTAKPSDELRYAAELMLHNYVSALPILEQSRLVGIISGSDIVDAFPALRMRTKRRRDKRRSLQRVGQNKRKGFVADSPVVSSARLC
jgi:CBS-domain-containing membrane protein